mgnify:CR=1 FL=1
MRFQKKAMPASAANIVIEKARLGENAAIIDGCFVE